MGTAQHKSTSEVDSPSVSFLKSHQIYSFKPYRVVSDTFDRRFRNQNVTRNEINGVQLPKPRSGHRIVCDDINVYSFGGYNPLLTHSDEADLVLDGVWSESRPLFKELWKYNIAKGTWKKMNVEQMPDILASNAVILSGHILMVYGGTGVPFGTNCSKDLHICDLGSDELKFNLITATGNCPQPQYGQAIVLVNHYLYTIGGTTGYDYTCDVHKLNLRNKTWEVIYTCKGTDNEPSGRYRHEVVFYRDKIYVLGGGTAQLSYGFKTVFAFNLSTCSWEKISTSPDVKSRDAYPAARRCHSCVQQGQYAYIIGGLSGEILLKDIWRLDLVTFEWKSIPRFSLGKGLYFHSSSLTPSGKLLTFGGIVESDNNTKRSATIHTAWLGIPKLKEICWEAVLFYYPYLDSWSKEELILFGLPYEFIQRLDLHK